MAAHLRLSNLSRTTALALTLCCAPALAETATEKPDQASVVQSAKTAYERGVAAYGEGRFRDAIEQFSQADRLAPRAALAFNIARAYDKLNEVGPALGFYREYLRRGAEAGSRAGVERRVRELSAALAGRGLQQVTVLSTPSGAAVRIDGRDFGATPATLELPPGTHRVAVQASGQGEIERNVELTANDPLLVEIELDGRTSASTSAARPSPAAANVTANDAAPSAAQPASSRPLWPAWLVLGTGGAALAGAGVAEVLRSNAASEARDAETSQVRAEDRRSAAESYQTGARVLLGVGGALVLGGAFLWYELQRRPKVTTSAAFGCDALGCAGGVQGVF